MAKYRGLSTIRLGALSIPPNVPTRGLAMGLGLGVVGALAARYALNTVLKTQMDSGIAHDTKPGTGSAAWSVIHKNAPAVGAALAAVAAFFIYNKKNPGLAAALAVGAGAFAVTQGAFGVAQTFLPATFKGLSVVKLGQGRFGAMLVPDTQRFGAMLVGGQRFGAMLVGGQQMARPQTTAARMGSMLVARRGAPQLQAHLAAHRSLAARRSR